MTLLAEYQAAVDKGQIEDNPIQRQILPHLQRIDKELKSRPFSWIKLGAKRNVRGLYLSGPVGVGKTFLLDLFYQYASVKKARLHFHHFMQQVDARLRRLQGKKNPLRIIASDMSKSTRLLCLDEFLVNDIAHAMILTELLQALFENGVVLVTTSNTLPDELYLNGLQRARFLPAIELIKTHCQILAMASRTDYRLGRDPMSQAYLYPLNEQTAHALQNQFHQVADKCCDDGTVKVQNRSIPCVKISTNAIWFQFDVICAIPRSQLDYLELAQRFDVIFISGIPKLSERDGVKAFLFLHFIDVMYDKGVRVVISAAVPPEQLYAEGRHRQAFERAISRLKEMQSKDYWAR